MNEMKRRTEREIGGEIWAAISKAHGNPERVSGINFVDFRTISKLCDLVMGVLVRHAGSKIINDEDFPVIPLDDASIGRVDDDYF